MSHFFHSYGQLEKNPLPFAGGGGKELTFDFISFIEKHLLNGANTSKSCTAGEERRYIRYGLHWQVLVGGFGDYLAPFFHSWESLHKFLYTPSFIGISSRVKMIRKSILSLKPFDIMKAGKVISRDNKRLVFTEAHYNIQKRPQEPRIVQINIHVHLIKCCTLKF